jgi:MurNAc alpha-1-phosphate uridylyltransferase
MDKEGRLTPRREAGAAARAPYAYMGVHIARPEPIYHHPQDAFGLFPLWVEMARRGRLFGALLEGQWMHVGDPLAVVAAEVRLAGSPGR